MTRSEKLLHEAALQNYVSSHWLQHFRNKTTVGGHEEVNEKGYVSIITGPKHGTHFWLLSTFPSLRAADCTTFFIRLFVETKIGTLNQKSCLDIIERPEHGISHFIHSFFIYVDPKY